MKSIIQVLPALEQGGVERGTIEIATALQKENIPNYVISSGGKMAKKKYHINPETLALERVEQGFVYWLSRSGWYILMGICLGALFFFLFFFLSVERSFFRIPVLRKLRGKINVLSFGFCNVLIAEKAL